MSYVYESRQIRQPKELEELLGLLKDAVFNQQLVQVRRKVNGVLEPTIESVSVGGPWPDILEMHFKHPVHNELYVLTVETYHGVGGSWQKE